LDLTFTGALNAGKGIETPAPSGASPKFIYIGSLNGLCIEGSFTSKNNNKTNMANAIVPIIPY
jgi:hypothetical protein